VQAFRSWPRWAGPRIHELRSRLWPGSREGYQGRADKPDAERRELFLLVHRELTCVDDKDDECDWRQERNRAEEAAQQQIEEEGWDEGDKGLPRPHVEAEEGDKEHRHENEVSRSDHCVGGDRNRMRGRRHSRNGIADRRQDLGGCLHDNASRPLGRENEEQVEAAEEDRDGDEEVLVFQHGAEQSAQSHAPRDQPDLSDGQADEPGDVATRRRPDHEHPGMEGDSTNEECHRGLRRPGTVRSSKESEDRRGDEEDGDGDAQREDEVERGGDEGDEETDNGQTGENGEEDSDSGERAAA